MPYPFGVWLVPDGSQKARLETAICELARRYDATPFPPHMTLFGGEYTERESLIDGVRRSLLGLSALTLPILGVAQSDHFFKTFYLELAGDDSVYHYCDRIRQEIDPTSSYVLAPHLSLLYARLPTEVRKELLLDPLWASGYLRLTHAVIAVPGPGGWPIIEEWQQLEQIPLED